MNTVTIVLIIVLAVLIAVFVFLYFYGKKLQKKKDEADEQLAAMAQQISLLVIDKKKMKFRDAGFPQTIMAQVPKRALRSKVPVAKVKVGPQISNFLVEESIFDMLPVGQNVKATVSGIYITGVKGSRKPIEAPEKKKGFFQRISGKIYGNK